ncbi:helix-turn-helix transcriptional regulator [Streptomyces rubellomurinus]|uniref:HTH luxR-type domain-containing protein n=1 Tax=Streptomyces rubellomurinus (strain ATCC 31215) TaxID=359131 RepID=A0A0F2TKZ4_STRR3|nr:helix-turn-helix transcriptional regulator [Streptomyces rubellomurinus]KJS63181.1 hypothetical protein VM95_04325 [Streptomyces rubellomurinus]
MTAEPAVAPQHRPAAAGGTGPARPAGPTGTVGDEPDEAAQRLYLAVVSDGGRLAFAAAEDTDQAALRQLLDLGLLTPNPLGHCYTAVSPRAVSDRLGAELRSEATRLLVRAESLPDALDGLTRAYDTLSRASARTVGEAVYVEGHVHIRRRIAQLVTDCRSEVLTAQPGRRPAESLRIALAQDVRLLQSGRTLRTVYQPAALADPAALAYAEEVIRHGSQIRVLDEPFPRLIVVDRAVAVIPAGDDDNTAAFITDPAALCFLVGAFERDWARADSTEAAAVLGLGPARTVPERVGRLLARGLTQRAIGTRLGLSERTVAAHISRLRDRHGARTLFQLGWLMRGSRDDR